MIIQPVRFGTAKISLVPEPKDLRFPPGPFCKTSAPVHPGQPRLLLCVCVWKCVCVGLHCLLTAGETVEGQRAGSWPPASVTLVKVAEQRKEVVAGE